MTANLPGVEDRLGGDLVLLARHRRQDFGHDLAGNQLASVGAFGDLVADLQWCAWCRQQVEATDGQLQILQLGDFASKLEYLHEASGRLLGPAELVFKPRQPLAMTDDPSAFRQAAANLNHIAKDALADGADCFDVLDQRLRLLLGWRMGELLISFL